MRTDNMTELLEVSKLVDGPLSKIAADNAPNTRLIEQELKTAGYDVIYLARKFTTKVQITKDGELVASGLSDTPGDALLHAMLGAVRERR